MATYKKGKKRIKYKSYRGYKSKWAYHEAIFNRYTGKERRMFSERALKGWKTKRRKKCN